MLALGRLLEAVTTLSVPAGELPKSAEEAVFDVWFA
jgi:hypothetical protein